MWFDELMDYCKLGIKSSNENKGVFIPIFLNLAVNIIMAIPIIILGIIFAGIYTNDIKEIIQGNGDVLGVLIPGMVICVLFIISYAAIKTLVEVGSINVYLNAIDGIKPGVHHFYEGISKYFSRVFGVKVVLYLLFILLLVPIIILFLIYSATIGVLTAGWGMIFGSVIIGVYFSTWIIATISNDLSGWKGVLVSFKLGKNNFWMLFILLLSNTMIVKYVATAFGGLIAISIGWIFSLVLTTYFKMILVIVYKNKHEQLL